MEADSPVIAVLAGIAGAILGLAADRLAVRWPEHDPEDAEHPAGRPLGWRTVVVVATSAIAFALLPARFAGDPVALALFGAWFVTLVIGLATDLDQRLLPDVLTLPVIPVALVYALSGLNPLVGDGWIGAVLAAIAIPAVLYLPSIPFGAGAFGMGDVKLLAGTGLMLGAHARRRGRAQRAAARRRGPRGPARGPPDRAALLRAVRAVPDHRRAVGRADPAARLTQDDRAGIRVTARFLDSVGTMRRSRVDPGSCSAWIGVNLRRAA